MRKCSAAEQRGGRRRSRRATRLSFESDSAYATEPESGRDVIARPRTAENGWKQRLTQVAPGLIRATTDVELGESSAGFASADDPNRYWVAP